MNVELSMRQMLELIGVLVIISCVTYWLGHLRGYTRGINDEKTRTYNIFLETTDAVLGGSIKIVMDRLLGHLTKEQMLDKLRSSMARREERDRRLNEYDKKYGADII